MQWTPGGTSSDIEDRRGESGGSGFGGFGGFGGGGGFGGVHLGIGGTILLALVSLFFNQNLFQMFTGGAPSQSASRATNGAQESREEPEVQFLSFVLDDAQRNWDQMLPSQQGREYRHAKLVLFRDAYPSGCGTAQTATGPFYCPADEKVYLDLSFFDELRTRFGASGEFAEAYVIAHEIGHHVQKVLGIESRVRQLQRRDPSEQNPLSVRLELQADCFAGVWANTTGQRKIVDESDLKDALGAAAAVGDDRIQRSTQGYVNPDSFTHGSSEQRTRWFRRGFESGKVASCNTFE